MQERGPGYLVKQLNESIERSVNNTLKDHGITMTGTWVLFSLSDSEDGTLEFSAVREMLNLAQPTCSGIVGRLAEKGFVTITGSESDGRSKVITITDKGRQLAEMAWADSKRIEGKLLEGFGDDDRKLFSELLSKALSNMSRSRK